MSKIIKYFLFLFFATSSPSVAQDFDFKGQISGIAGYGPDNSRPYLLGGRFVPELGINIPFNENRSIDFLLSFDINASSNFDDWSDRVERKNFNPYRLWARYTSNQFELRLGLQKIEFGSATVLRPLQWFTSVDARDPLQLTDGVYGVLARYYFLNNANIWAWILSGNENRRGLDILLPDEAYPEVGGRIQYPIASAELAASFHHRQITNPNVLEMNLPAHEIQNRIGIDGKVDLLLGLWFETSYSYSENWNQALLSLGGDYSFEIGNTLNIALEHLIYSFENIPSNDQFSRNYSSLNLTYPFSFFDQFSSTFFYEWGSNNLTLFLNYVHQFSRFDSYLMGFYNPRQKAVVSQLDFIDLFSGPGIRGMVVVNL